MNLLQVVGGAAGGFLMGGPVGAGVGAATAMLAPNGVPGGISNAVGNGGNVTLQGLLTQEENDQLSNMATNVYHDERMQWQATYFNEMLDERSESMRETNQLRNVAMEQRKADDEITKEFVHMIKE